MNIRSVYRFVSCVAAAFLIFVSPAKSNASLVIEHYEQGVYQWGTNPSDVSSNFSLIPGSLSTSSASGFVSILNSSASSTSLDVNYSLALGPIDTYGYAFAFQSAIFHVDAVTNYSFSMSPYSTISSVGYNIGQLIDITNGVSLFDDFYLDGTGSSHVGLLQPGVEYSYFFGVQPAFCPTDSAPAQLTVTGQASLTTSAVVPEPSSIALAGFGGLGMAFYGYRRRRVTAAV